MNKNEIKQQITILIEKIREQSKKNSLNELEMILSDIRELYEKTVVLNYLNSHPIPSSIEKETHSSATLTSQEEKPVQVDEEIDGSIGDEKSRKDKIIKDTAGNDNPQIDMFETSTQQASINEKAAMKKDAQSIASEFERKPISDLKSAIGINEKFLFINELFGGSTEEYNNSLNHLNECKDRAGANDYINAHLKEKHQWDDENNAVSVFMNLVERRFI